MITICNLIKRREEEALSQIYLGCLQKDSYRWIGLFALRCVYNRHQLIVCMYWFLGDQRCHLSAQTCKSIWVLHYAYIFNGLQVFWFEIESRVGRCSDHYSIILIGLHGGECIIMDDYSLTSGPDFFSSVVVFLWRWVFVSAVYKEIEGFFQLGTHYHVCFQKYSVDSA